jgi:hypothetical protein
MQKQFLRSSSRVLRGSQILKSSIIADENNLEAQQKGAEEESHHKVREAVTGASESILGSAMGG